MEKIIAGILELINKIPFMNWYLEKNKFDIQYSKEILKLFSYEEFNRFTDNIANGYFWEPEKRKMIDLDRLACEKKFFDKTLKKNMDNFISTLNNFINWSIKEFVSEPNSNKIKIPEFSPGGQRLSSYDSSIKECPKYAIDLFEKYKKIYFAIQKKKPSVF